MRADNQHDIRRHYRRGLRLSTASIIWTLGASGTEIVIGIQHHVLSLLVFGAVGLLDAAGSVTLVVHFRHALRHDVLAEEHERRATLVISAGLICFGVATVIEGTRRLIAGHAGSGTAIGTAVAIASIFAFAVLAAGKLRIGRQVDSTALTADGWLSASGAVLAALAVLGATLGTSPGRSWIDPLASIIIAAAASTYGIAVLVAEQRRHRDA